MSIIFQKGGNFWIESIVVARASIGSSTLDTDINLERAGRFLGGSVTLDADLVEGNMERIQTSLEVGGTNNSLTFGLNITQIRLKRYNAGGAASFGAYILIFMGK